MSKKNIAKSGKDIIMILLAAKGPRRRDCEAIRGRTRLMKMVFLFKKEVLPELKTSKVFTEESLPDFTPYDYGPFSPQVFSDLQFLIDIGFVEEVQITQEQPSVSDAVEYGAWISDASIDDDSAEVESGLSDYKATKKGKEFFDDILLPLITDSQMQAIEKFKTSVCSISLKALLRYVYERYPKMTTKSKILDDVLGGGD